MDIGHTDSTIDCPVSLPRREAAGRLWSIRSPGEGAIREARMFTPLTLQPHFRIAMFSSFRTLDTTISPKGPAGIRKERSFSQNATLGTRQQPDLVIGFKVDRRSPPDPRAPSRPSRCRGGGLSRSSRSEPPRCRWRDLACCFWGTPGDDQTVVRRSSSRRLRRERAPVLSMSRAMSSRSACGRYARSVWTRTLTNANLASIS